MGVYPQRENPLPRGPPPCPTVDRLPPECLGSDVPEVSLFGDIDVPDVALLVDRSQTGVARCVRHSEVDGGLVDRFSLLIDERLRPESGLAVHLTEGEIDSHADLATVQLSGDCLGGCRRHSHDHLVGGVRLADEVDEQLTELTEFAVLYGCVRDGHYGLKDCSHGCSFRLVSGLTYRTWLSRFHGIGLLQARRICGPVTLLESAHVVCGRLYPNASQIAEITINVAKTIRKLKVQPKIALLSYSNFGSSPGPDSEKMAEAVGVLHAEHPTLIVDGEIQANFALNSDLLVEKFPFSTLVNKEVNTLIFPNLSAGNISYKLLQQMTDSDAIGPILIGMRKSIHVLQLGASVREIINMVKVAVSDAQNK